MSKFITENNGTNTYLVYTLDAVDEIDEVALGMLKGNTLPNILPVYFTQFDTQRVVKFNISSKVALGRLINGTMSKRKVLRLFDDICNAMMITEEYLLDNKLFLLGLDFVFCEPESGAAYLTYLPLMECRHAIKPQAFFKEIIVSIKSDPFEDGSYVAKILNYLNTEDNFSVNSFRHMLSTLSASAPVQTQVKQPLKPVSSATPQKQPVRPVTPATPHQQQIPIRKDPIKAPAPPIANHPPEPAQPPEKPPVITRPAKDPTHGVVSIPTGLGFEIPGRGKVSVPPNPTLGAGKPSEEKSLMWLLHNFSGENLEEYRRTKGNQPVSANKGEKGKKKKPKGKQKPYTIALTSMDPGKPYVFHIDQETFNIGRSQKNDGVITDVSNEISRFPHCQIIRRDGCYYLVDCGKYGTKVNGAPCKANGEPKSQEIGPLENGSIIELPGISFKLEYIYQKK